LEPNRSFPAANQPAALRRVSLSISTCRPVAHMLAMKTKMAKRQQGEA
jgi:hypothetical protein